MQDYQQTELIENTRCQDMWRVMDIYTIWQDMLMTTVLLVYEVVSVVHIFIRQSIFHIMWLINISKQKNTRDGKNRVISISKPEVVNNRVMSTISKQREVNNRVMSSLFKQGCCHQYSNNKQWSAVINLQTRDGKKKKKKNAAHSQFKMQKYEKKQAIPCLHIEYHGFTHDRLHKHMKDIKSM